MSVNEKAVWRIISTTLVNHQKSGVKFSDSIHNAWTELLKRRRKPGGSVDLDLAAAEHYMFARWCVASGNVSKSQMIELAELYYLKKKWDAFWGDPNAEATTKNPVSKPDIGVAKFGILGAIQGATDHTTHKVAKKPPLWRPPNEILGRDSLYGKAGTSYSTT